MGRIWLDSATFKVVVKKVFLEDGLEVALFSIAYGFSKGECSMTRQRIVGLFLLLILALPFQAAANGSVHEVAIEKYKFIPAELTIKVGDTVRWVNKEKRQYHSVWFEGLDKEEPEYFFPDEHYERTFDKPGTFKYRCGPHEEMLGVIHVK